MEQAEGNTIYVEASESGGSLYLLLSTDIKDYLGFDSAKHKLIVKFDKGKHGRFIGIGIVKKE